MQLLKSVTAYSYLRSSTLRSAQALNRITADVDTLDGLTLRLLLPAVAAVSTWILTFVALGLLTHWWLATSVLIYAIGSLVIFRLAARKSIKPARLAEAAFQSLRVRTIDLLRARTELTLYNQLDHQQQHTLAADNRARQALAVVDQTERHAALCMSLLNTIASTVTFILGAILCSQDVITPPQAALGFLATLALAETIVPLRRGISEIGRVFDAARRVNTQLIPANDSPLTDPPLARATDAALVFNDVCFHHAGSAGRFISNFTLSIKTGEKVALTGLSGSGKSTLLLLAAGLLNADSGTISINGSAISQWPEQALRDTLALLPQRSVLLGGTIREALTLAKADATDHELIKVLGAVAFNAILNDRDGLDTRLLEGGEGLSGGEGRRLALARLLLRQTPLILLDEPTEGLDESTAIKVLNGINHYLPHATVLIATHRDIELEWVDRIVSL